MNCRPVASRCRSTSPAFRLTALTAVAAALLAAAPVEAKLTRLVINAGQSQSPIFSSTVFAESGAMYEKIAGTAFGEVDPNDPLNAVIVDITRAPTVGGKVQYSHNFVLLKPIDLSKGNHRLFSLIPNRGSPAGLSNMIGGNFPNVTPGLNMTNSSPGDGFLMRKGYSILIMGWDPSAAAGNGAFNITTPVATDNGTPIVGPSLEEFVIDNATANAQSLTYTANNAANTPANKDLARLSYRVLYQDAPQYLTSDQWEYVNPTSIRLLPAGTQFKVGLWEFTYPARDPVVAGLGLAAMRDIMSFFRYETADSLATPNPLAGDVQQVYTHCLSQPCRTMHDYMYLGFNEDESHRPVVSGILNWIGGGNFLKLNWRFSNRNGRTHRQHIGRWYPEFEFPFSNNTVTDPFTGRTDGRYMRCLASSTCPKSFEINSENEYWAKGGSNLHFHRLLLDLPDPPMTRTFLMSSLPHGAGTQPGMCQQFQNPLGPYTVLRAMLVALDEWVTNSTEPPASRIPRVADGTLAPPLPQSKNGFPVIPARPPVANQDNGRAVRYNGRGHTGDLFDYGPRYLSEGIIDNWPPIVKSTPYPVWMPKNDSDGNNIAGVRLPEVTVPTATYTGWALRANLAPYNTDATFAGADGCDASGQKIPFRKTAAGRLSISDPRKSLDERYPGGEAEYVAKITAAAQALRDARLMLQDDVDAYIAGAPAAWATAIQVTP